MKRITFLYTLLIIMIICISCKSRSLDEAPEYPVYQSEDRSIGNEDVKKDDRQNDISGNKDEGADDSDVNKVNGINQNFEDFAGLNSDMESQIPGNLGINIKLITENNVLVCPDLNSNKLYYINYGSDNYVYKLDGGKAELLAEDEAISLYLWDNNLYYLVQTTEFDGQTLPKYSIYKYNLETGEKYVFKEDVLNHLHVNNEGLYYLKGYLVTFDDGNREYNITTRKTDFNGNEIGTYDCSYSLPYKNYMYCDRSDIKSIGYTVFMDIATGNEIPVRQMFSYLLKDSIYQDKLYYIGENHEFCILDLVTGERQTFDTKKILVDSGGLYEQDMRVQEARVYDYTVINETAYLSLCHCLLLQINLTNGEISLINYENILGITYYSLYTDGSRLYATKDSEEERCLVELIISDNSITERRLSQ